MAVYVDDMKRRHGRLVMCHMVADTPDELRDMARRIGVNLKWVQFQGTPKEHMDICMAKRLLAVDLGAREVTKRHVARMVAARRSAL